MDGWKKILNSFQDIIPPGLNLLNDLSRTYVVIVNSNDVDNSECKKDPTSDQNCHDDRIRYCGLVRKWN